MVDKGYAKKQSFIPRSCSERRFGMRGWFVKVPDKLFTVRKAGPLVSTYIGIMSYGSNKGYAYPGIGTVAKDLKWSSWKITNLVKELVQTKFIFSNKIENRQSYWGAKLKSDDCVFFKGSFIRYFLQKTNFTGLHLAIYALITRNEIKGELIKISDLTKFCCVAEGKVCLTLKELCDSGFIEKTKTQRTNIYKINHEKEKLIDSLTQNITDAINPTTCFFCSAEATTEVKIEEISIKCCHECSKQEQPKSLTQIVENIVRRTLSNEFLVRKLTDSLLGVIQESDCELDRNLKINTEVEFSTQDVGILLKVIQVIARGSVGVKENIL